MILRFPYVAEPIQGPPPPSLPSAAQERLRPLVPIIIRSPLGPSLSFGRALADSGADDTIFPLDTATLLGIPLLPATGHAMRWRGQRFFLRFGAVELELVDNTGNVLRWPAIVAFTGANIRYPLLGVCGCFQYMNATFLGDDKAIEFTPTPSFPATP